MKKQIGLEDRVKAVSSVIGDWVWVVWLGGSLMCLLVFLEGRDEAGTILLVKYGVIAVLVVPLLILGATLCVLRLHRAWRDGRNLPFRH